MYTIYISSNRYLDSMVVLEMVMLVVALDSDERTILDLEQEKEEEDNNDKSHTVHAP